MSILDTCDWRPVHAPKRTGAVKFLASFQNRDGEDTERSLLEDLAGEAAQNTGDLERESPEKPATIEFEVRKESSEAWSRLCGTRDNLRVLRVSNRNVAGLGGAISNGPPDGDYQKFMGFDSDSTKISGGGAYGYGRSTYFIASNTHRILVDTVFTDSGTGKKVRRLVGVRFMTQEEITAEDIIVATKAKANPGPGQYNCDGISVWGESDPGLEIRPIDEDATVTSGRIADIARNLGLHRAPGDASTGTDFYVLDLKSDEALVSPHENVSVEDHLYGALLWRLWPAIQDRKIEAAVVYPNGRRQVSLDYSDKSLWPVMLFARLRDEALGLGTNTDLQYLGGKPVQTHSQGGVHSAAQRGVRSLREAVHQGLRGSYPGNVLWHSKLDRGQAAVVRFRDNLMVVNYDASIPYEGEKSRSLEFPPKNIWHIGLVEVRDPDISGAIRSSGEGKPKIEDVSHTNWNWTTRSLSRIAMRPLRDAFDFVGRVLGVERPLTITTNLSGAPYLSRRLGDIFGTRKGAPGGDPGERDPNLDNDPPSRSKKELRATLPRSIGGWAYYVFTTEDLVVEETYGLRVEVQGLGGTGTLEAPEGLVIGPSGSHASIDLDKYKHVSGQEIAIKIPKERPAIRLLAEKTDTKPAKRGPL